MTFLQGIVGSVLIITFVRPVLEFDTLLTIAKVFPQSWARTYIMGTVMTLSYIILSAYVLSRIFG